MEKYKNSVTGQVIYSPCEIYGENWAKDISGAAEQAQETGGGEAPITASPAKGGGKNGGNTRGRKVRDVK